MSNPAPSPAVRARGLARMKEIASEDAAKRQRLVVELLAGLGRTPTAMDRLNIETMAAAHVRADRLRTIGRSDIEERRLIVQLQRAVGWRSAPPGQPKSNAATIGLDYVREKYGQPTSEAGSGHSEPAR